jgi:hypothetical protein
MFCNCLCTCLWLLVLFEMCAICLPCLVSTVWLSCIAFSLLFTANWIGSFTQEAIDAMFLWLLFYWIGFSYWFPCAVFLICRCCVERLLCKANIPLPGNSRKSFASPRQLGREIYKNVSFVCKYWWLHFSLVPRDLHGKKVLGTSDGWKSWAWYS